jgi:hypothetical protein
MTRTDTAKNLRVFLHSKFYFHNQVSFIFYQLLGLVRSVTFNFSSLEHTFILYFRLVRSKVEYGSVVCNTIASTKAKELERIQQKFAVVCFNCIFPQFDYSYALTLE